MNRLAILALMLLAPARLFAQYSVYASQALSNDGSTIYQSVQLDGSADMSLPPSGPSSSPIHTPYIYSQIGPNGGWYMGNRTCANCYISFSLYTAYAPKSPSETPGVYAAGQVNCSIVGTLWQQWLPSIKVKISIANYRYDHNDGKNCYFKLACLSTQPSCYAAPWLVDVNGVETVSCETSPYFIVRTLAIITNTSRTCLGVGMRQYSEIPIPCQ